MLVSFRDAGATAQAELLGVDRVAPTTDVTGSVWPVIGAFGAATMAVGLVLNVGVFITGVAICAVVAVEWLMDAWADRATGDREANRTLRNRIMAPWRFRRWARRSWRSVCSPSRGSSSPSPRTVR